MGDLTQTQARSILDAKWESCSRKIDWLTFEQFQRDVLESNFEPMIKLALLAESIGAWTGRGVPSID